MKLLGWMHRKFRNNSGDPYRDVNSTGYPCNCLSGRSSMEEESQHPYFGYQKPTKGQFRRTIDAFVFSELEDTGCVDDPDEEAPQGMDEFFHGLLTVGTLGSLGQVDQEDTMTGALTPTFGVPALPLLSVEDIAEKEEGYEATEDDLMAINAELEKVLLVPEVEKSDRISSARASQVSAKQLVISSCPLQSYLFGSLVDMTETTAATAGVSLQEKREHRRRTSLGELFLRSNIMEEGELKREEREKTTAGMNLIVKMLKRRGSSKGATCNYPMHGESDVDGSLSQTANSWTKFNKIIQKFHRKVHPDNSSAAKKVSKSSKCRSKSVNESKMVKLMGLNGLMRKEGELTTKNRNGFLLAHYDEGCGDSSGNREHWIKTDAEYLVLEL